MCGSAECAARAESTLNELVDTHDGLARLKSVYMQRIKRITLAQTLPSQGDWCFVRTFTTFWQKVGINAPFSHVHCPSAKFASSTYLPT